MTKVIGVRFRTAGKIYFFSPGKLEVETGDKVIVETARVLLLPLLANLFTKFFYFECMFLLYQYSDFSTIQKQLQIIFSKTIDLQVT